uniref:F-box domain-containing protein n=1 Tax=Leersia perrieri TaxID=77586 RepID=A0A0D9WJX0_9ORYZ
MAAIMYGETILVELWWEILLRVPTKDAARSCCVSKQWRDIVKDPSFQKRHHDRHVVSPPKDDDIPDTLVVVRCDIDGEYVSSVYPAALVSPSFTGQMPMCRINNPHSYTLANVCNGFLCFASWNRAKVIVCNPVTGEKLSLPKAPPLVIDERRCRTRIVTFALGFSPTTGAYKLFRFADRRMDVYTLGETSGWRRNPISHPCRVVHNTPTVVVGGKICMLTPGHVLHRHPFDLGKPGPVLVVDVASEEHRVYNPSDYGCPWDNVRVSVCAFELHGSLCLAVRTDTEIQFWAVPVQENDEGLPWQMLYKLKVDMHDVLIGNNLDTQKVQSTSAWLDNETHTLCYRVCNRFYSKYVGTTMTTTSAATRCLSPAEVMTWDNKIRIQSIPSSLLACEWDVYAGYRPNLLSPLTFSVQQDNEDDESGSFTRNLLCTRRHLKSKKTPHVSDINRLYQWQESVLWKSMHMLMSFANAR